jgi:hypothetical protein
MSTFVQVLVLVAQVLMAKKPLLVLVLILDPQATCAWVLILTSTQVFVSKRFLQQAPNSLQAH